ncbi:MAG: hypothetical protein IBJ09_08870 [Bacteroidia bacterium]|nr:hypothetical protein [Bacteroidia bacterium]
MMIRLAQILSVVVVCMHTATASFAQQSASQGTYASPELKEKAEREAREKGTVPAAGAEKTPGPEKAQVLPDFTGYMSLVSVEAMNIAAGYTPEQESGFRTDARSEFELNDGKLDLSAGKLFFIKRLQGGELREFSLERQGSQLRVVCATCVIPPFTIVEESAAKVILDIPSQDEDARFSYRYTFVK